MACGGFTCSKNALCSLNVVYMLVGLLLIGVAAWAKGFGIVFSIHIIGGVIAVGVFLLLIAIVGLIGALNHHQVMLFFYMVILLLVFLFQFGVSCSCLAMNRSQQVALLNATWKMLHNETKVELEMNLNCCGLLNITADSQHYLSDVSSCQAQCRKNVCQTCGEKMLLHSAEALKILGGVGLFFSFTEVSLSYLESKAKVLLHIITTTPRASHQFVTWVCCSFQILGVWLAARYRNQKDPRANPSAFL